MNASEAQSSVSGGLGHVSVIVPVLNEQPTLVDLHRRLRDALGVEAELVFVDDGSSDSSASVLRAIAGEDRRVRALRLRRHRGKSEALEAGFSAATGSIIATIDADLQEEPEAIVRLAAALEAEDLDLITGWRRVRRDPWAKVAASRIYNALASVVGGLRLRDINCGLKVMRREVLEEIVVASGFHRLLPLLAHWKGYRVGEREVSHAPRAHGASRFGRDRAAHGIVDLFVVLFLARSDRRPSRMFLGCGSLLFTFGSAVCVYMALLKWTTGTIQSRYPLLVFGVLLFLSGLQLLSFGFFAELWAHQSRSAARPRIASEDLSGSASNGGSGNCGGSHG